MLSPPYGVTKVRVVELRRTYGPYSLESAINTAIRGLEKENWLVQGAVDIVTHPNSEDPGAPVFWLIATVIRGPVHPTRSFTVADSYATLAHTDQGPYAPGGALCPFSSP